MAVPNGADGVLLRNTNTNTIGGGSAVRNVMSGNTGSGVHIVAVGAGNGSSDNVVRGNYIGLNDLGTLAVGNREGVWIDTGADFNNIGGTTPGQGNVISGIATKA